MVHYTSIMAGQKITLNNGGGDVSMGYRAKRKHSDGTYEYGFVTCAHGSLKGNEFCIGTTIVGVVTARKYGGDTDAAFVQITNSNYTASNSISGTTLSLYPYGYSYPAVGTTVKQSGYASGVKSGVVTSINWVGEVSGTQFTHLTQTSIVSKPGDSGGILFSNDSTPYVCGIVTGGNSTNTVYTQYGGIINNLDVIRY